MTLANILKPAQEMAGETETLREACCNEDLVQPHSEMPVVASPVVSVVCSGHRDVRITDEEDRESASELVRMPCCYALHGVCMVKWTTQTYGASFKHTTGYELRRDNLLPVFSFLKLSV